ncbi:MAG: hypothetical protein ACRDNG_08775, partial [Gaiellaceae bacterium]
PMDPLSWFGSLGARAGWSRAQKWMQNREARRRQLREPMMSDARDFATGVGQAIAGVRAALRKPAERLTDVSAVWNELPEVNRLVGEAEARLARVQLDFGPDSSAATAAEAAIAELRSAAEVLRPGISDLQGAAAAAERAEQRLRTFNQAAGEAIRA